jgi:hypothetical protein
VGATIFLEAVGGDSKNCPLSASSRTASIVLRRFPFFSCAFFLTFGVLNDASMGASPPFCCAQQPLLVLDEGSVLIGFLPFSKVGTSPRCPLVTFFRGSMSG